MIFSYFVFDIDLRFTRFTRHHNLESIGKRAAHIRPINRLFWFKPTVYAKNFDHLGYRGQAVAKLNSHMWAFLVAKSGDGLYLKVIKPCTNLLLRDYT